MVLPGARTPDSPLSPGAFLAGHDILVIGASSGGVEATAWLVGGLPADLPAAVFVVVHIPEAAPSMLPRILDRAGPLSAAHPAGGEPIEHGRVYVAPPGLHLLVERGRVRVAHGPKENRHRPAVDPLFRSAATAYGPRVAGVILTGARNDGTAGLLAVKRRGGVAVVQEPDEALFSGMPESALEYVDVDHRLPLEKIPPLLDRLAREESPKEEGEYPVPDEMEYESKAAGLDPTVLENQHPPGTVSAFTCPDCAGPLYEMQDGDLARFRCRVGHAYTPESMLDEKDEALESALYMALNTLEEAAAMSERLAKGSRERGQHHAAARFEERARENRLQASVIRRVLIGDAAGEAPGAVSDVS